MPFTTNNLRRITWDPEVPNEYEIRWRELGQPNWVVHPTILTVPEAIFGITVAGEPLPNVVSYIAILDLAKNYEFQIRHKCSANSWSSWTAITSFNSYLPCPEGGTGGFTFNVVEDPAVQNGVEIEWGYDCKNSNTYPIITLYYKLATSLAWSSMPYSPRDGNHMFMALPFGIGTYQFKIGVECSPGIAYESAVSIYGLVNPLYPPTLAYKKTFRNGIRIVANYPITSMPIYGFEYRVPTDSILNYVATQNPNAPGISFTFLVDNLNYSNPAGTSYNLMVRLDYGNGLWSSDLLVTFVTAPENYTFTIDNTVATGNWLHNTVGPGGITYPTPGFNGTRLLPLGNNNVYPSQIKFQSTGHAPNTDIYFDDTLNNNCLGKLTDPGLGGDPGNYSHPEYPPRWGGWAWEGITPNPNSYPQNHTKIFGDGRVKFYGVLPSNALGECWIVLSISGVIGSTF